MQPQVAVTVRHVNGLGLSVSREIAHGMPFEGAASVAHGRAASRGHVLRGDEPQKGGTPVARGPERGRQFVCGGVRAGVGSRLPWGWGPGCPGPLEREANPARRFRRFRLAPSFPEVGPQLPGVPGEGGEEGRSGDPGFRQALCALPFVNLGSLASLISRIPDAR